MCIYYVDSCLAILPYLFNNNSQNGKADFICQLLNNMGFNIICVDYRDANSASIIYSNTFKRLLMILERDIKNVSNFFAVVHGNKITIHIDYAKKCKVEFDFEFSSN